jgi:thiamine pyrophosphokinase
MRTAVVVAGGDPPPDGVRDDLPEDPWVVAADSGADAAVRLGLTPDVIVGDLDSIAPATLAECPDATVMRYPEDKNATDLELALDLVSERDDIDRVILIGGTGGRLDHFLGIVTVIAAPSLDSLDIEWLAPPGRITVVRGHRRLHGTVGSHVSLIALGGDVAGVRTTGLVWPLDDEILEFGSGRGVSNRFASAVATVTARSGVLLVVQPED